MQDRGETLYSAYEKTTAFMNSQKLCCLNNTCTQSTSQHSSTEVKGAHNAAPHLDEYEVTVDGF